MKGAGIVERRRGPTRARGRKPVGHWARAEEISLDSRFGDLLPPAAEETRRLTEEAIFRDGWPEPLIVWRREGHKILLVGYDVFPIFKLYRIPFRIIERQFPSSLAAELFVVQWYLGKNRLTPLQASYLRGLRYKDEKLEHGGDRRSAQSQEASCLRHNGMLPGNPKFQEARTKFQGGDAGEEYDSCQNGNLKIPSSAAGSNGVGKTASALSQIFHVSARTIHRDGALAAAVKELAANCGGQEARDLLLKPGRGLTHGRILAWAALSAEEQKTRLMELRLKGKWTRGKGRSDLPLTITLPRQPRALARAIFNCLGAHNAAQVRDALNRLLNGTAREGRNSNSEKTVGTEIP